MVATPDNVPPDDRAADTAGSEAFRMGQRHGLPEPLPSSEMFLAAFAGQDPVSSVAILDPALDLVATHRQHRLAFQTLSSGDTSIEQLKQAAAELVSAQTDIEMLIAIIDDAVVEWLKQRRTSSERTGHRTMEPMRVECLSTVPRHTESIGEIAARMADLWEAMTARSETHDEVPEAAQLSELCVAYDELAAAIESGQRLLPGL